MSELVHGFCLNCGKDKPEDGNPLCYKCVSEGYVWRPAGDDLDWAEASYLEDEIP